MPICFIHIPKSGGSSLRRALIEKVGECNIAFDYAMPFAQPAWRRKLLCLGHRSARQNKDAGIIFGHFLAGKYAKFSGTTFTKRAEFRYVTFLRDPLQRAISHYLYWKRVPIPNHALWQRFNNERWTLERFLLADEFSNIQSEFLWRFPLSSFDFIGITEHYNLSVQMLASTFQELRSLSVISENMNPNRPDAATHYAVTDDLMTAFVEKNAEDYLLYKEGVELFFETKKRLERGESQIEHTPSTQSDISTNTPEIPLE